jgi:hypothetical protein
MHGVAESGDIDGERSCVGEARQRFGQPSRFPGRRQRQALLEKGVAPSPLPIGGEAKGEDVVRGHVVHIVPLGLESEICKLRSVQKNDLPLGLAEEAQYALVVQDR